MCTFAFCSGCPFSPALVRHRLRCVRCSGFPAHPPTSRPLQADVGEEGEEGEEEEEEEEEPEDEAAGEGEEEEDEEEEEEEGGGGGKWRT